MRRDHWYEQRANAYAERLRAAIADGSPSAQACRRLFETFLAVTGSPSPDPAVERFFYDIDILTGLSRVLLPSPGLDQALGEAVQYQPPHRRTSFFRVRQLGPLGLYPNLEVESGRAAYVIRGGVPYLVTLNSPREDAKWHTFSELSDWTRHETRLATAISCTEYGGFTAYLGQWGHDFPSAHLSHVDSARRVSFMIEYVALAERARQGRFWRPEVLGARGVEYGDFSPYRKTARSFARKFLVSQPVLLRTGRQFVKASMLWQTDGLREDAMVTLMFTLEGCLLLLQEANGGRTDRLDRKLLRRILVHTYRKGETLYDMVEEGLGWGGTRAQLVHPHLAAVEGWTTQVMADDYYDFHKVVAALLTYVVTGATFEEYELAI